MVLVNVFRYKQYMYNYFTSLSYLQNLLGEKLKPTGFLLNGGLPYIMCNAITFTLNDF
jgi:hypothetical protein